MLLQTGDRRLPELPDTPTARELALDETKRQAQDLWLAPLDMARPYAMPPETPSERVEAVRRAFGDMLKDPEFQADAKKSGMVIDPRSAADIRALLDRFAATPKPIIEEARKAVAE